MINNLSVQNFRRFKSLTLHDCGRINIVVGDNGAGKTALLEALFLAVAHDPQKALHLRQTRGLDGAFSGAVRQIEEALYGDIFYQMNPMNSVEISLRGDGPECRTLRIFRGSGDIKMPTNNPSALVILSPILFEWTSAEGLVFTAKTKISASGVEFESTQEDLPNFYFFQTNVPVPSGETATNFSKLSVQGDSDDIAKIVKQAFEWIDWIGVESVGGAPAVHASVRGSKLRYPLTTVSGAINRFIAILVAVAQRPKGFVLVDEIENGMYYTRHAASAHAILTAARQNECQMFVSTHSKEWLRGLIEVAGKDVRDIVLWRLETDLEGNAEILRFSGDTLRAGIEHDAEVRGDASSKASIAKRGKGKATTRQGRRSKR